MVRIQTAALFVLLAAPGRAADIVVAPGQSIQAAMDQAAAGDRVLVQPAVYNEAIDFKGKAIQVIGLGGPLSTILDATGLNSAVVKFHNGEGRGSVLKGFTVTGGFLLPSRGRGE